MSKRELIDQQLDLLTDADMDRLLDFLRARRGDRSDLSMLAAAAETSLAKDWLSREEDEAWAAL